jgi:hypothetical protein
LTHIPTNVGQARPNDTIPATTTPADDLERSEQQQYDNLITEIIGDLAKRQALGEELSGSDCVVGLVTDNPANARVRDFAIRKLRIKAGDFDRALKANKVRDRFGRCPRTPREFVHFRAKECRLAVRYNGRINQDAVPFLDGLVHEAYEGKREYLGALADHYEFRMYVQNRFKDDLEYHQFRRQVRIEAAELDLPWTAYILNDACDAWYDEQKKNRLWQLFGDIDVPDAQETRKRGEAALRQIAETCFDEPEGPEFVVAILKRFIWQVKRRCADCLSSTTCSPC